jgi:hypothetical protein
VLKPVKGKITPLSVAATGYVYLSLPPGPGPCPPSDLTAQSITAALATARFAALPGRPGVSFLPPTLNSLVANSGNNKTIAEWKLDGLGFGLHSNAPLGATFTDGAAGGAKACTELVFTNGTLHLDSPLVGKRSAELNTIAQNITTTASAVLDKFRGGKLGNLTLTIKDASFMFDISPEKTPGVHSTTMLHRTRGDVVAVAALSDRDTWIKVRGGGGGGCGGVGLAAAPPGLR